MSRFKLVFFSLSVFCLSFLSTYSSAFASVKEFQVDTTGNLTTNLLNYYKLEDATDFYGGVNGTAANVTFDATNGKVNNGSGYNGSSSKITMSSPTWHAEMTVAFWAKTNFNNLTEASQRIFIDTTSGGSPTRPFLFYYEQGGHKFGWNSGGANVIDPFSYSFGNISGQWHLWIFEWLTPTSWKVYYDNAQIESGTAPITVGTPTNMTFGVNGAGTASWFNGAIDEFGIWDRALSAQERTDLYNGGAGQTMVETSTPTSTTAACSSDICQDNIEHIYLWLIVGLFSLAAFIGYKIML